MKLLYPLIILFAFCSGSVGFKTSVSPSIDVMIPRQEQIDMDYYYPREREYNNWYYNFTQNIYKDTFKGFPKWFTSYAISSYSELTINDSKIIKIEIGYKAWSIKQDLIDSNRGFRRYTQLYYDNLKSNYNQLFTILYLLKWRNIDIGIGTNSTSMTDNMNFREGSIEGEICIDSGDGVPHCSSDWKQRVNSKGNGYLLSLRSNHKLKNRFDYGYTLKYSKNIFDTDTYFYNDDYNINRTKGTYSFSHIEIGYYLMLELINILK